MIADCIEVGVSLTYPGNSTEYRLDEGMGLSGAGCDVIDCGVGRVREAWVNVPIRVRDGNYM